MTDVKLETRAVAPLRPWLSRLVWFVLFATPLAVFVTAALLTPDPSGVGTHTQLGLPPCGVLAATGLPCPGCGLTTCFASMVRLDVVAAFRANPFGVALFLGSVAAMKVLASQLFGVSPRDPTTLIAVVAAMTVAAAAASYFPARRAMNVNPIVALRGD